MEKFRQQKKDGHPKYCRKIRAEHSMKNSHFWPRLTIPELFYSLNFNTDVKSAFAIHLFNL